MNTVKTAEILCVGTELLLGDIVNTNAAFLSRRLAELGICVYRHTAVGDNVNRLKEALESALASADLVITSGGLGPTYDDLTKETVAEYFGKSMEMHLPSLERIRLYFMQTGREMTANNEKQAMMPVGATVFENNYGTAPALALYDAERNKTVIMLPGPPGELIPIFNEKVLPYLKERTNGAIVSKNVHIFGIGESAVEEKIRSLMIKSENPTVAPYCKEGEVRLRVTAKAANATEAKKLCNKTVAKIYGSEVGRYIYGTDVGTLENALVNLFLQKKLTLACAESCTGGLIGERITSVSGSSAVFAGGCITYTNEIKEKLLGVSRETLEKYGAVSPQTAVEMAQGARLRLGTDIAVSTTGIAGPSGGTADTPVGTVFIGLSVRGGCNEVRRLSLSPSRSRDYIRAVSASNAINMALKRAQKIDK